MGQKTIKVIDLSKEEKKPKKEAAKERPKVKSGKRSGRIADMSGKVIEKAEKISVPSAPSVPSGIKKPSKKPHLHSHRFAKLRKMVKRDKLYPPQEAVKLLKQMANASFDETIELHLVSLDTGVLGKVKLPHPVLLKTNKAKKAIAPPAKESALAIKTEKKFPLAHLKIGQASWPEKKLLENLNAVLAKINLPTIRKAVLTSTMSPGIKLELSKTLS